ncbi:MAG: hypothetical protein GXP49_02020 [Deltaproteobacteria bacterium]|nr:hypothetical protein [Deltaproteobacteria bacterium]
MKDKSFFCFSVVLTLVLAGCTSPERATEQGDTYTISGNFAQAEKSYRKALEKNPTYIPALSGMAKMYDVQDMEDTALDWYQKVIEAPAKNDKDRKTQEAARKAIAKVHMDRGDDFQLKGAGDKALAEYDKALEAKPGKAMEEEIQGHKDNILFKRYVKKELMPRFQKTIEHLKKTGSKVYWIPETQIFVCEGSAPFNPKEWKGKKEDVYGPVLQKRAHDSIVKEMTRVAYALAQVPQKPDDDYKVENFVIRGQQWVNDEYVIQVHMTKNDMFENAFEVWRRSKKK